ncbi:MULTISPECIES: DUF6116 family protein [unclassified Lysobacter]
MARFLLKPFMRWAEKLRHPTLFWIVAVLFFFDLLIPDFIPFVDEILLGLGTMLLANWKSRAKDVLPPR